MKLIQKLDFNFRSAGFTGTTAVLKKRTTSTKYASLPVSGLLEDQ